MHGAKYTLTVERVGKRQRTIGNEFINDETLNCEHRSG